MDLVTWLREQIDSDELAAKRRLADHTNFSASEIDPEHLLRAVVAHRKILDEHPPTRSYTFAPWPCAAIRALAEVYSDRPGYTEAVGGET